MGQISPIYGDIWTYGHMTIWPCGYTATWPLIVVPWPMALISWTKRAAPWPHGPLTITPHAGVPEKRAIVPMPLDLGPQIFRPRGSIAPWAHGP